MPSGVSFKFKLNRNLEIVYNKTATIQNNIFKNYEFVSLVDNAIAGAVCRLATLDAALV